MEAFESFVALSMSKEGLVVYGPLKFMIKKKTKKIVYDEYQTHGYEVDLIGARSDKLVLATVKSFFGSDGVRAKEVSGESNTVGSAGYKLLNDFDLRAAVIKEACLRYGYREDQVEMRLYAGKFAGKHGEKEIRDWAAKQIVGSGPIGVYGTKEVVADVKELANSKTYVDNATLVAVKVLAYAETL
jgi:hypothetical protein